MTTILGSFRLSRWPTLSNMVRISINLRVRCVSPFCRRSEPDLSESEGDEIVAATRAAITASSPSGTLEDLFDRAPPFLSPSPSYPSFAENKSWRNRDASKWGNRMAETVAERVSRPPEAVSSASAAISFAASIASTAISLATSSASAAVFLVVLTQGCDFCLNSAYMKGICRTGERDKVSNDIPPNL